MFLGAFIPLPCTKHSSSASSSYLYLPWDFRVGWCSICPPDHDIPQRTDHKTDHSMSCSLWIVCGFFLRLTGLWCGAYSLSSFFEKTFVRMKQVLLSKYNWPLQKSKGDEKRRLCSMLHGEWKEKGLETETYNSLGEFESPTFPQLGGLGGRWAPVRI